ncbi:MAG: ABC transporter ATP-binding protein [Thermoanaerobaculia bacterium]
MSVAVTARGVEKAYVDGARVVEVLKGVDLEVTPGEFVAIVGPSGAGKSTLLHLLGALDRPDRGSILVADRELSKLPATRQASFRNRTIGFVFQFHELLADFTALENVMLPGRIAGRPAAEVAERARDLLREVGLEHRMDHYPSQLSGGERQRVAIGRALLMSPPLLLVDEPTGNLDPVSGEQVFSHLLALQRTHGTTAVLVTHNPEMARRCGRVLTLEEGRLTSISA